MKNKFQKITLGVMLLISLFTFSQIAYAGGPDYEEPTEEITENPMTEKEENPLTPDGNATLVDQASDKDGKEFYTFTSPAGNQFFLIIDKQRSDNNVYFLDYVTEKDLISLAKKDKENPLITEAPEPETKQPEPEIKEEKPEEKPVEEERSEKKQSNAGMFLIFLLVTLGVGIVAYYFKILKPKQELEAADDFEEIEFLTEEDTENEEEFEDLDLDMEETSEFSEEEEL
jgi:bacteriocin